MSKNKNKGHEQKASLEDVLGLVETPQTNEGTAEQVAEQVELAVAEIETAAATEETVQEVVQDETVEQPDLFPETLIQEPKVNPSGLVLKEADADGTVRDEKGNALFKRITAHLPEQPVERKRTRVEYKPANRITDESAGRLSNAALLTFPTDRWGITKDLKIAFTNVASRIAGDENKKRLVEEVLAILTEHLNEKFKVDAGKRGYAFKQRNPHA